jgi:hypothetical protein
MSIVVWLSLFCQTIDQPRYELAKCRGQCYIMHMKRTNLVLDEDKLNQDKAVSDRYTPPRPDLSVTGAAGMNTVSTMITNARSYLELSLDGVQRVLATTARPVPGDEYGQMTDLTSMEVSEPFPGTLYLKDGVVALVRVNGAGLTETSPAELTGLYGESTARLRSRAGKTANLWVWPDEGIACSVQGETIHFLEVYPPCSRDDYEARIYREPPRFIR